MPVYIYTTLDDPFALTGTEAGDTNATGQVVGNYQNAGGNHGFLYNNGSYTILEDPFATNGTWAVGINDAGQVVGQYFDGSNKSHGFLYSGGVFTTIDVGAIGTSLSDINDAGQISGTYTDGNGRNHGFLLTITPNPPPPAGTTVDIILRGSNSSPAVA